MAKKQKKSQRDEVLHLLHKMDFQEVNGASEKELNETLCKVLAMITGLDDPNTKRPSKVEIIENSRKDYMQKFNRLLPRSIEEVEDKWALLKDIMRDLNLLLCEFEEGNKEEGLWSIEKRKKYFELEECLACWILYATDVMTHIAEEEGSGEARELPEDLDAAIFDFLQKDDIIDAGEFTFKWYYEHQNAHYRFLEAYIHRLIEERGADLLEQLMWYMGLNMLFTNSSIAEMKLNNRAFQELTLPPYAYEKYF